MELTLLCLTVYCGDILFCWWSVFIQAATEYYAIGISMTRRFRKSVGPSVRPSVCLFVCPSVHLSVCNANKKAYSSFIIDSRKIIRISDERAYLSLQENEEIFLKIFFKTFRANFRKILYWHKMPTPPSL